MIRVIGWLLRLFPASFRERYGDAMLDTLDDRARDVRRSKGRRGLLRFWAKSTCDVLRAALLERRDGAMTKKRAQRARATLLDGVIRDVRVGARRLSASPGFSLVAVCIIALGIGANSAIFALLHTVVLRALPYPEPEQLVEVWESNPSKGYDFFSFSHPNYLDYRERNETFVAFAAYSGVSFNLTGSGEPVRLEGARITHEFFPALGVEPILGRGFTPEEDRPGGQGRVVLLGHALWQQRFGGDPGVLGTTLQLSGASYTVIGVLPPLTQWLEGLDLVAPLNPQPERDRRDHRLSVIGRLAPGVTPQRAEADLDAIAADLAEKYPAANTGYDTRLMGLHGSIVGESARTALFLLMGAVALVLLVAGANLASLFLARAAGREHELALSVALGARRWRLVRQLLVESMLLAGLGCALGLALARGSVALLRTLDPSRVPRLDELRFDETTLVFAIGLSIVTGLFSGLLPAWQASGRNLLDSLQGGGRGFLGSRRAGRVRVALVVTEIAVAVVLLVGAALLMQSLYRVTNVDPGLSTDNVIAAAINVPFGTFEEKGEKVLYYQRMLREIEAIPGTEAVSAVSALPFGSGNTVMTLGIDGLDLSAEHPPSAQWRVVTPRYFDTVDIPLLAGRAFDDADDWRSAPTAIISRVMAERFWPGEKVENVVGKRFRPWEWEQDPVEIVGVVGDVRERDLETAADNMVYLPFYWGYDWPEMHIVVRTQGEPLAALSAIRSAVARSGPEVPLSHARSLSEAMERTFAPRQFNTLLFTGFAIIATALAAIGIYGVVALAVSQRRSEIGVRLALGARPGQILRMVLADSLRVAAIGGGIGLLAATLLGRMLGNLLYDVSVMDPTSIAVAAACLALIAVVASVAPARRAARVDAAVALRPE